MSDINSLLQEQLGWIVGGMGLLILILFILVLMQGSRIRGMRRRYASMMGGTGIEDLETLLIDLKNQSDRLEEEQENHARAIEGLLVKVQGLKAKVALKRYNAFGERGNDLSFSLAIVDEHKNGIVLTSLHSRDSSYIYSKPLEAGASVYALSPEEQEVIAQALQQI
ncbi:DUF4446 family protein [Paenibacillus spiritus]|uniref:DUF4446 family protein n=1 Tax=Paenibacillus spiritus TaxID=2496557 RepID=A0A5J5GAK0_9BACL|nr:MULTISPECIES: DUF4446 family protein [Paenibacillus]KAA9005139.1 DUF4446 family protein [Paenibacillus spiritus]